MSERLSADNSVLVVVDVQERFRDVINEWEETVENVVKVVEGCRVLGVPILHTEQYPKGLGKTVNELRQALDGEPVEKVHFSCMGDPGFRQKIGSFGKKHVILCGIEAHVCVLQTALDLMDDGHVVHVVVDAVSSRKESDKKTAVRRMLNEGAAPETVEMVLFQLLKKGGTEEFKKISKIVK